MKKNVAIIVQCLYSGGAERIAGLLSKELCQKYNTYLFLIDTSNIIYDYGGQIIDLSIHGVKYVEYFIGFYKRKYHIDCAISFLEPMNFMNIKSRHKESIIISERCAQSPMFPSIPWETVNIKRLYNYADKVVSVAHGVKYDLVQNYGVDGERITTIYNFIDKETIRQKAGESLDEDILSFIGYSKMILNVGRLHQQKNQAKLIMQFSKLLQDGEDVKLLIIGTGNQKENLNDLIDKLKINNYVKIIDYNKNPFPYYKYATMLALTSDYEGLPNVILEAMVLGIPIVAVDCISGPRELLKDSQKYGERVSRYEVCERGILVENVKSDETGETDYFKEAMEYLLHNRHKRELFIKNSLSYMEKYKNEEILNQWLSVIENVKPSMESFPKWKNPNVECAKKVIVYGAGELGRRVMRQYIEECNHADFLCFAVSSLNGNEKSIDRIPVFEIGELSQYKNDAVVLIGVCDTFVQEVLDTLAGLKFRNIQFPLLDCLEPDVL